MNLHLMTLMPRKQANSDTELISVVLSTYNERENLSNLVPIIENVLAENGIKGEIVVVDDNSPDGTSEVARQLEQRFGNVRLLWRPGKMGPGSAHSDGYRFASGDIIVGMDTDFSHSPYDIPKFVEKIREGFDVVVGSRYISGGQYEVKSTETLKKSIASRLGNILIRILSGVPLHDFTTALRAIRREVVHKVKTESKGNSFFMEFVIKSYRNGYRMTELPIVFRDRVAGKSKLSLGKQSFKMLFDLLSLTRNR
jgi:dolichol-phosphate mannosyltransferase